MRKYLIAFLLICLSNNLIAQVNVQNLVESQLKVVKKYLILDEKVIRKKDTVTVISMDKVIGAVIFLEDLSGIKCDREQSYDEMFIPSRNNLKAWKTWYRKNKSLLYWNEKENKISFRI